MVKSANLADTINADYGDAYDLDAQIGFLLRRAHQRHVGIFTAAIDGTLTPQQFTVLARLNETKRISQNELGRRTAMDQSTINGVVQRLLTRGLVAKTKCNTDKRMILLTLTDAGREILARVIPSARESSKRTLVPLTQAEQDQLLGLLRRIC